MLGNAEKKHAQEQGRTDESRRCITCEKCTSCLGKEGAAPDEATVTRVMSLQVECSIDDDDVRQQTVDVPALRKAPMIADFLMWVIPKARTTREFSATNVDELLGGRRADDLEASSRRRSSGRIYKAGATSH